MAIATQTVLTESEFNRFRVFIYDVSGITLVEQKRPLLSNRLRKRMRELKIDSYEEYYMLLTDQGIDGEEFPRFLDAVTTNETYFFRNDKLWPTIRDLVVPTLLENKKDKKLAQLLFWSAACSCGAEPYTLAILLDQMKSKLNGLRTRIVASDISRAELDKARKGVYVDRFFQRMEPSVKKQYFKPNGQDWEICDEMKRAVEFRFHNLKDSMKSGRFDCVILRNVLMYFDEDMKDRAYKTATEAILPGGIFIVGDVDQLYSNKARQEQLGVQNIRSMIYRKLS